MKSLLLHICCMPCGVGVVRDLILENYQVTLYFSNSNIFPLEEYEKRLAEVKKIALKFNYPLIIDEYNHSDWQTFIKGYENEPERGERCRLCYLKRLKQTYEKALELDFDYFSTTLTVSPHKDAQSILKIGQELNALNSRSTFLNRDFKKKDGFKKAKTLACELNLYQQNYCGCEYSIKLKNRE